MLGNTSLNDRGEPIAQTAADALDPSTEPGAIAVREASAAYYDAHPNERAWVQSYLDRSGTGLGVGARFAPLPAGRAGGD